MTQNKELEVPKYQSDTAYRPLGLDPWRAVFADDNELDYDSVPPPSNETVVFANNNERKSSFQLAMEVASNATRELKDESKQQIAAVALMSTLANQAGRNGRYDKHEIRERLYNQYDFETYADTIYGKAGPEQLARTVIENDDLVTSLEVARHTHVNQWEYGHDINTDVRKWLCESPLLGAKATSDLPRYKLKGFFEQAVLAERKRRVFKLLGGQALVVMRLNFLIDKQAPDLPSSVLNHIRKEEERLKDRESGSYDFDAENELLCDELDARYIRTPFTEGKPQFIIPLQTGYYAYSPNAHALEKEAEQKRLVQAQETATRTKAYWTQDWQ